VKYLLLYDSSDDALEKAPIHYDDHCAFLQPFVDARTSLFASPLDDPRDGAVSVWTTREAAEEFAAGDPFVRHGVVSRWQIVEWPD
jgi:uncharacterized protein YciI